MARRTRETGKRRKRASSGGRRASRKHAFAPRVALRWVAVRLAALGLVGLVAWIGWTDIRVRAAFEGKRWSVPARIYARPLELWSGRALGADELEHELEAAGYHAVPTLTRPASYVRRAGRFDVLTRSFRFPDAREPSRRLRIELRAGQVRSLIAHGEEIPIARLDPALIGRIYPTHSENRVLVRLADVPSELISALVAVEDRAFTRHFGLSPKAIARAAWANLRAGARVQGGSTLTQQLAKNFFLSPERSWTRKVNEALIALLLELHFSKSEILEAYLNEVFLGQQGQRAVHGFGLAARHYFLRQLDELELHEVALLVGLVRGPSLYNPRRHPERARERRDLVLRLMANEGLVEPAQAAAAARMPLGVSAKPPGAETPYPAFVDLVRRQLSRDYRDEDLRNDGLRVFTTLEPSVQRAAERVLAEQVAARETGPGAVLQGAVVVTDPASGAVQAIVGGRRPREAGFNRALDARRPVGSLIKPAVYLTALARPREFTLVSALEDAPVRVAGAGGETWSPKNYDGRAHGSVPLYLALARSYNLATVRLGLDVGVDAVAETLRDLGVTRPLERYPSLLLGAVGLSPLDVARVYQTIAAAGFRGPLRAIEAVADSRGRALTRYRLQVSQVVAPEPVFLTVEAMRAVMTSGTGRNAYRWLDRSVAAAGKTGTTDGLRDSWFAGFTGNRLAVVWLGRDDNGPTGLTGSSGALPVWAQLMAALPSTPLPEETPEGVRWYWTTADRGVATDPDCPGAVPLPFITGSQPPYVPCTAGRSALGAHVNGASG